MYMKVYEAIWWYMDAYEVVYEPIWKYMKVYDGIWMYIKFVTNSICVYNCCIIWDIYMRSLPLDCLRCPTGFGVVYTTTLHVIIKQTVQPLEFENREAFSGTYPNIPWHPLPPPPPRRNCKIHVDPGMSMLATISSVKQLDRKMGLWKKTGEENCGNWTTVNHDRKTTLIWEQNWDLLTHFHMHC